MKTIKRKIFVAKPVLVCINRWLAGGERVEDCGHNEILYKDTAVFPKGIEVDIKVVNSDDERCGPYVDAVIFQNGNEIYCLEPAAFGTLHGEYIFEVGKTTYVVVVKCDPEDITVSKQKMAVVE